VLALAAVVLGMPSTAHGQDDLVDSDASSLDPIGIDASSDLDRIPVARPADGGTRGPQPSGPRPIEGEVLTAIPGVREDRHQVEIALDGGLADVSIEIAFVNRSRHRAEVQYRLALPPDAALGSLEVCVAGRCVAADEAGAAAHADAGRAYEGAVRGRPTSGSNDAPIGLVRLVDDARGHFAELRAAPIPSRGGTLTARLRYLASAPVYGGVARFTLPARGTDPRVAPAEVRARSARLAHVRVDGAAGEIATEREPWSSATVTAEAQGRVPHASLVRFPCTSNGGAGVCTRLHAVAGRSGPRTPADLFVLIDASASTEGPARGRIASAVAAVLAVAPSGSNVMVAAFGAHAEEIISEPMPAADVPIRPIVHAAAHELGASTRFEAAWTTIEARVRGVRRPMLIVVGDGGISDSPASRAAFAAAAREGATLHVLNVADRPTWAAWRRGVDLAGGNVVEAGTEAEAASRGRETAPLEERVHTLFSPLVASRPRLVYRARQIRLGQWRAGDEHTWEGPLEGTRARVAGAATTLSTTEADEATARALRARHRAATEQTLVTNGLLAPRASDDASCDERGPASAALGVSSDESPVVPATRRTCSSEIAGARLGPGARGQGAQGRAERARLDGRGIPAETVLGMLRQRVVPEARECFRRDRQGRADYSVRATYQLELADREIISAAVEGEMEPRLRACLLGTLTRLDIPRFAGRVRVAYPVYTERESPPPTIDLRQDVANEVDRVAGEVTSP
jgi:hypothetical protein